MNFNFKRQGLGGKRSVGLMALCVCLLPLFFVSFGSAVAQRAYVSLIDRAGG